jgi:DNA-binding transcriptional MocR family regulator
VAEDVPLEAWTERCLAHGVVFYPGSLYNFNRQTIPYICLGFAAHTLDEQNEACSRMALALKETRAKQS